MYVMIVTVVIFLIVALSSWWLDEFDETFVEASSEGERQSLPALQEQVPTIQKQTVHGA